MDTGFMKKRIIAFIIFVNTVMICLLTFWSLQDRRALTTLSADIKALKQAVELEIKLREEILPQIKKSAGVLQYYNPDLDDETALAYAAKIYQCSDERVPHDILTALIIVESRANHKAVSREGALGLTQVLPEVWNFSSEELLDPYMNIEAGATILKAYIERYGLVDGLRAYNSGPRRLHRSDASTFFAQRIVSLARRYF